jgi:cobalamin biosynthesis protein CobT
MAATTAKIVAGVAGGYLLGRTKKLRLAITVAGLLAGKKLAADPKSIVDKMVEQNPELQHLKGQLTEGLTSAAKELAVATAASRMEAVTETLQQGLGDKVQGLTGTREDSEDEDSAAEEDEDSAAEEDEDSAAEEDEGSAEEEPDTAEDESSDEDEASDEDESSDEGSDSEDEEPRRESKKSTAARTKKAPAKKSSAKKSSAKKTSSRSKSRASKSTASAR